MEKSLLSSNRKYLMGFAILFIMFCHNSITIGPIWSVAKQIATVGVDVFLFLSGYGLYCSYKKGIKGFYKRRFFRIIPTYVFIVLPYIAVLVLFTSSTLKATLWNYSIISFFVDGVLVEWFVAAILVLYILFPVICKIASKKNTFIISSMLIWSLSLFILYGPLSISRNIYQVFDKFIIRIPVFIAGVFYRKYENEIQIKINELKYILILVLSVICIVFARLMMVHYWPVMRLLFFFTAISLSNVLSVKTNNMPQVLKRVMLLLGTITFELYLSHEKVLSLLTGSFLHITHTELSKTLLWAIMINLVAIVLSIIISIICHKIITHLTTRLTPI